MRKKWLIEIYGKAFAADAGQLIYSGVVEADNPHDGAAQLHSFTDKDFWAFHYYDFVNVSNL